MKSATYLQLSQEQFGQTIGKNVVQECLTSFKDTGHIWLLFKYKYQHTNLLGKEQQGAVDNDKTIDSI